SLAPVAGHEPLGHLLLDLLAEPALDDLARDLPLPEPGDLDAGAVIAHHPRGLGLDGRRGDFDGQLLAARTDVDDGEHDAHRWGAPDPSRGRCERGDSNPQPDLSGLDPKSSAYTNSATFAMGSWKGRVNRRTGGEPPRNRT